jgi:signal transduction histidine kinase
MSFQSGCRKAGTEGAAAVPEEARSPGSGVPGHPGGANCDSCDVAREGSAERARLASWLAHELRTPLNCVLGYAELLCDGLASSTQSSLLTDAERVRDLALHQLALLDDVLDLTRLEHGSVPFRTEPVDAVQMLGEVAAATLPLVERGGNRLYLSVEANGRAFADATRLRQVLLNLVGNASKFTRAGLVALGASASDGSVSFHVRDTGCGMTPSEVERAFRPYQQANGTIGAVHGGTGLGLAISRELCERMGGSLSVESIPGEGTTFTVSLPVASGTAIDAG